MRYADSKSGDRARQTDYEEVSLPPYIFLSMSVLLTTSTSSTFHSFSGRLTEKASRGVLSWPVLLSTSTSYISCFFGHLTEFVAFKVLTDFLIGGSLKFLNSEGGTTIFFFYFCSP